MKVFKGNPVVAIVFGVVTLTILLEFDIRYTKEEGLFISFNRGNVLPSRQRYEE